MIWYDCSIGNQGQCNVLQAFNEYLFRSDEEKAYLVPMRDINVRLTARPVREVVAKVQVLLTSSAGTASPPSSSFPDARRLFSFLIFGFGR